MGQEFKSGPDITGFDYEAGSGQDLVWSLLIGKLTQYHIFIYHDKQAIFELFLFGHQLYTFESDVLNNFLSNIWWRKALRINHLRIDYSL